MINALGVLGYGVGGIEAEAVLLGQPLYQPMPQVVGVRLTGELPRGSTATDLVLVVTELLRRHGVVGAFVEFAGDGLAGLSLADRATISNMSPEFGATATLFPIDDETLAVPAPDRPLGRRVSRSSSATPRRRACGAMPGDGPDFDERLTLDLATVAPSVAGPRRPQDRVPLESLRENFRTNFPDGLEAPGRRGDRGRGGVRRVLPGVRRAGLRVGRRGDRARPARRSGRRRRGAGGPARLPPGRDRGRRRAAHDPDRLRGDRGDHLLHEHLEPDGHGRGRPAGPERRRPRPAGRPRPSRPRSPPARRPSPATSRRPG